MRTALCLSLLALVVLVLPAAQGVLSPSEYELFKFWWGSLKPGQKACNDIPMKDFIAAFYLMTGKFMQIEDPHDPIKCQQVKKWLDQAENRAKVDQVLDDVEAGQDPEWFSPYIGDAITSVTHLAAAQQKMIVTQLVAFYPPLNGLVSTWDSMNVQEQVVVIGLVVSAAITVASPEIVAGIIGAVAVGTPMLVVDKNSVTVETSSWLPIVLLGVAVVCIPAAFLLGKHQRRQEEYKQLV